MEVSKIQGYDLKDKTARNTSDKNAQDIIKLQEQVNTIPDHTQRIEAIETKNTEQDETIATQGADIEKLKGNSKTVVSPANTNNVENDTLYTVFSFGHTDNDIKSSLFENVYNGEKFEKNYPNRLKVATYNIENEGAVPYRQGLNHFEKSWKLHTNMSRSTPQIVCLQETLDSPVFPNNEMYSTPYLKNTYFHSAFDNLLPEMNYGITTVSKFTINSTFGKGFDTQPANSDEADNFTRCTIKWGSRTLQVYNLHMSAGQYEAFWKAQCAEIEQHVANNTGNTDNVIIMGDFNFDTVPNFTSYFPTLSSWGYKLAYTGDKPTQGTNWRPDNIIVSSNINVISASVDNSPFLHKISDHYRVSALLEF